MEIPLRIVFMLTLVVSMGGATARTFVDDAGRKVELPDKVERVYAAGPPASVLVFALAPDKLIGWTRAFRLLREGKVLAQGTAATVLTGENLSALYGIPVNVTRVEGGGLRAFATWPTARSRP